jgi:diamine N-acetyltransferase
LPHPDATRLSIRPARPGDAGLVLALVRELADYERLAHAVEACATDLDAALFGPQPRVFCDLAAWDDEPAGFALWFYTFSTFRGRHGIWLEDLYVRPALRGHGIGRALFCELGRRCATDGLGRLEWSVLDWNEPAVRFYRGLGARPVDGWTTYRLDRDALAALADG